MTAVIEVEGLVAWYLRGRPVLDGVTFRVEPGEVVGLLGQNGAGKTTLLRVLSGLHHPQAGRVTVAGRDLVRQRSAAQRAIGYLPEEPALDGEFRVCEYLQDRAALKGLAAPTRTARVRTVLSQVGLAAVERQLIGQLSKGYRQRLGLADALLAEPAVLLLDEPTDGLDPGQRAQTLQLIASLAPRHTVLLSTHVLPEAESICQRVLLLQAGRMAAAGTPAELAADLQVGERILVRCCGEPAALLAAIKAVPGVVQASRIPPAGPRRAGVVGIELSILVELQADHALPIVDQLARAVLRVGELRALSPQPTGLASLFQQLTQRVA